MTTTPNALSNDGASVLLTDQHGRGLMLSIGQFERDSLATVVEAAVDEDLSIAEPHLLEAISNPAPSLIHPDRCLPYQKIPPVQTVADVGNLWTIYTEHYVFIISFAGFFLGGDWTISENIDII